MKREYIQSERAHFMCPNMYFGILLKLNSKYDHKHFEESFSLLAKAHPFLRSVLQYEENSDELFYQIQDDSMITLIQKEDISHLKEDYKEIGNQPWDVFHTGLLKVIFYPSDTGFQIIFLSHHLLGDGRSILNLANEFVLLYNNGIKPILAEEHLIKNINDLPEGSDLRGISKYLVNKANQNWDKEKGKVCFEEYQAFEKEFSKSNFVGYAFHSSFVEDILAYCRKHNITVNDFFLTKTLVHANTDNIIIASDIRSKLKCYTPNALGNYSTAFTIHCKSPKDFTIKSAQKVHTLVQKTLQTNARSMLVLSCYLRMRHTLIDAAAIASLGNFQSKAASFVGCQMFGYKKRNAVSVTNLGMLHNPGIESAYFIPPASPAAKITIGILSINNSVNLCCSFYQEKVSCEQIKKLLHELPEISD